MQCCVLLVYPLQVICVGQIIGAIVAETREQAKQAAKQLVITYQDIQPVFFTIEVYIQKILYNGVLNKIWGAARLSKPTNHHNLFLFFMKEAIEHRSFFDPKRKLERGNLEEGFEKADHILEGLYN